jgi:hypothetical protein
MRVFAKIYLHCEVFFSYPQICAAFHNELKILMLDDLSGRREEGRSSVT